MTSRQTITAMVVFVVQLIGKLASIQTTLLDIPKDIAHNFTVTLSFYDNTFPQLYYCLVQTEFETCTINYYQPPLSVNITGYGTYVQSITSISRSLKFASDLFYVSCNYSVIPGEIVCQKINGKCDINSCQLFHLCGLKVNTCVSIVRPRLGIDTVTNAPGNTETYITQECSSTCPKVVTSTTNMISNPITSMTSNPTTSMTSNPTTSMTSNPTTSMTSNPTTSMTSNPTTSMTSNPTTSMTSNPATRSTATPASNSMTDSNPQLQTSMTSNTTQPDTSNSNSTIPGTDNKGNTETDNNDLAAIVGSVCGLIALFVIIIICFFLWRRRRFQANKSSEVYDSTSDSVPSNPDPYYNTLNISGRLNGTGIVNFTENDYRIGEVLDSGNKSTEQEGYSFLYKHTSNQLDLEVIKPPEHDNLSDIYDFINEDEMDGITMQSG